MFNEYPHGSVLSEDMDTVYELPNMCCQYNLNHLRALRQPLQR